MNPDISWIDVATRLVLTLLAGALVGWNRGEKGRAAGLRTTILVCLAASAAMIQANLLLATRGRHSDSFVMLDTMRLPLGILSGIGFIGAGAMLRRGSRVQGVTTAATLWFVTVMGLCFGGGQLGLGMTLLVLSLMVLWGLKRVEQHLGQEQRAMLWLTVAADGPGDENILAELRSAGCSLASCEVAYDQQRKLRRLRFEVHWHARNDDIHLPEPLRRLRDTPGILHLRWRP